MGNCYILYVVNITYLYCNKNLSPISLSFFRVVLVPGDIYACYRLSPVRKPDHGGQVFIYPIDRPFYYLIMGTPSPPGNKTYNKDIPTYVLYHHPSTHYVKQHSIKILAKWNRPLPHLSVREMK